MRDSGAAAPARQARRNTDGLSWRERVGIAGAVQPDRNSR